MTSSQLILDWLARFRDDLGWILLDDAAPRVEWDGGGRLRAVAEHPASEGPDRQRIWLALPPLPDYDLMRHVADLVRLDDPGALLCFAGPRGAAWVLLDDGDLFLRPAFGPQAGREFRDGLRDSATIEACRLHLHRSFDTPTARAMPILPVQHGALPGVRTQGQKKGPPPRKATPHQKNRSSR